MCGKLLCVCVVSCVYARVWCVMVCSISGMSGMMYTVCGIVLCDVVTVVVVSLYVYISDILHICQATRPCMHAPTGMNQILDWFPSI